MRLASPWFLLVLPFVAVACAYARKRRQGRLRYSSLSTIQLLSPLSRSDPRNVSIVLRAIALVLLCVALARPQSGKRFTEITSDGIDILLALDTSGSMRALDLKIDDRPAPRVDVVKKVAAQFIAGRPSDRIGVVVFGDTAFLQCPLTLDHSILTNLLQDIHVGVAGDATAIGDAIGVAVNHMRELKAKSKVIILLTDGQNNSGVIPPLTSAQIARTYGIKIYTIGVGVEGRAPFLVDTPFGKRITYQQSDLDEETLKKIADITGARFYRAKDSETLQQVYHEIDQLEKTQVKVKEYSEYNELFAWFALPGLICFLVEIVLGGTLFRRVP